MKKFRFRMEGFRKIALEKEREIQMEVLLLRREETGLVEALSTLKRHEESLHREYNQVAAEGADPRQLIMIERFLGFLELQEAQAQRSLIELRSRLAEALGRLEVAHRETKRLTHLKEKQKDVWLNDYQKQQQGQLEEMATIRFIRDQHAAAGGL